MLVRMIMVRVPGFNPFSGPAVRSGYGAVLVAGPLRHGIPVRDDPLGWGLATPAKWRQARDVLEEEEAHIDRLETPPSLIDRVGMENYLQSQM